MLRSLKLYRSKLYTPTLPILMSMLVPYDAPDIGMLFSAYPDIDTDIGLPDLAYSKQAASSKLLSTCLNAQGDDTDARSTQHRAVRRISSIAGDALMIQREVRRR